MIHITVPHDIPAGQYTLVSLDLRVDKPLRPEMQRLVDFVGQDTGSHSLKENFLGGVPPHAHPLMKEARRMGIIRTSGHGKGTRYHAR